MPVVGLFILFGCDRIDVGVVVVVLWFCFSSSTTVVIEARTTQMNLSVLGDVLGRSELSTASLVVSRRTQQ